MTLFSDHREICVMKTFILEQIPEATYFLVDRPRVLFHVCVVQHNPGLERVCRKRNHDFNHSPAGNPLFFKEEIFDLKF